jgi:peptide deformylase
MPVRDILKMGDSRLLRVAKPVPASLFGSVVLQDLLTDLQDTMVAANGAGLAAPQIGVDLQVVLFGTDLPNPRYPEAPPVPRTVLCNPVIEPLSDELQEDWEGCLSVPGLRGVVPRWQHVRYRGLDEQGQVIEREVSGFHARVVQHECDHLTGTLYPSRVRDFTRFGFTSVLFPGLSVAEDD